MKRRKNIKGLIIAFVVLTICLVFVPEFSDAQCAMCRASAGSNLANGGTEGQGLNTGILYLLAMPYLLVGTIGFLWWRNNKRNNTNDISAV